MDSSDEVNGVITKLKTSYGDNTSMHGSALTLMHTCVQSHTHTHTHTHTQTHNFPNEPSVWKGKCTCQ